MINNSIAPDKYFYGQLNNSEINIYINDIINASTLATFILFADDPHILFKDKCLKTL